MIRERLNDGSTIPHTAAEVVDYLSARLTIPQVADADEEWPEALEAKGERLFYSPIFTNDNAMSITVWEVLTFPTEGIPTFPPVVRDPIPALIPEATNRTDWLWDVLSVDTNIVGFDVDGTDWLHIYFSDGTLVVLKVDWLGYVGEDA